MPSYVVGASVGAGLGVLLLGYVWYSYVKRREEEKSKDLRRVDFYAKQVMLVAEAHAEMEKFLQREAALLAERKEQKRLRDLQKRKQSKQKEQYRGSGAYATGPVHPTPPLHTPLSVSDSSSDTNISELHSGEVSSESADHMEAESWESEEDAPESELGSSEFSAFAEEMMCEMDNDSVHTGDNYV